MNGFFKSLPQIFQSTEFLSAITGAVVGGLIAFVVQIIALREARRVREHDRKLVRQGLAQSLIIKLIRIYSNAFQIHGYIEECFTSAKQEGFEGKPWQIVRPLANPPADVHFSPDEMGLVLSLGDPELFQVVIDRDVSHNSISALVLKLNHVRQELTQRLHHDEVSGDMISGTLTQGRYIELHPLMNDVDILIAGVRQMAKSDAEMSSVALKKLEGVLNEKLGMKLKIELKREVGAGLRQ